MRFPRLVRYAFAVVAVSACSSTEETGNIALVTGVATDVFTKAPVPTSLELDSIDSSGNATILTQSSFAGATTLTLPDESTSAGGILRFLARDATGAAQVWGQSLAIDYGVLGGATFDLFVQRTGELAEMPDAFAAPRTSPVATIVDARFLFVAGGSDASTATTSDIYDLLTSSAYGSPPTLPRAPLSIASLGTLVLLVDSQGATWFDLSDSSTSDASAPSGGAFSEVAGGRTIVASDGSSYVVGATRSGDATSTVLALSTAGALSFAHLSAPRAGAAATWVDARGVVVAGGSTSAGGVEILAPGDATASTLAYPSDATIGAGATPLDAAHIFLAGGLTNGIAAATRSIDLSCAASCSATVFGAPFSTPLTSASAFAVAASTFFVVGVDAMATTHAFRVTSSANVEVPFVAARNSAIAIALPNTAIGVVGGATTVESFTP